MPALGSNDMSNKQDVEIDLVRRLFGTLGIQQFTLEPSDRPDVIVVIDDHSIGIEVTVFHVDESMGGNGSSLRVEEERKAKDAKSKPYMMWVNTDPLPGLVARIKDKISVASTYDNTRYDELWLLVVTQFPKMGAISSTFVLPNFIDLTKLDNNLQPQLNNSIFAAVYIHAALYNKVYKWSPSKGWRIL
jgi:hypothetical protein